MDATSAPVIRSEPRKGLKLLSLDAGGCRNISQLEILKHAMEKACIDVSTHSTELIKRPCEVFDVIGGVGTGGLISILLVTLELTVKETLEDFIDFSVKVFKDINPDPRIQTRKLKRAVQDILDKHKVGKNQKLIRDRRRAPKCRLILPITYKTNVGATCVLTNFSNRREPSTNLTVLEAMVASCATTPIFSPIPISKDYGTFEYISGDIGLSNPIREVIAGTHRAFGDEAAVACLFSIGCGHTGANDAPVSSDLDSRVMFLERVAMDSERVAAEMNLQMSQLTIYHRISVKYGLEDVRYLAWKNPYDIVSETRNYLDDMEVLDATGRCIDSLKGMSGSATLGQMSHSGGGKILASPLPPSTPIYVEREGPTLFLENAIFDSDGVIKKGPKIVTMTGIGGCGKTQLVRRFIEKYGNAFTSVCFIDGSSDYSIQNDITQHVRSFGGACSQYSFPEAMRFLSQPVTNGQRLMVIDNVDDHSLDLNPFLPRWVNGVVLITSRNQSRGQMNPSFHLGLDVMSLDESVELLVRGLGMTMPLLESDRLTAITVAEELGFLPIALVQAISYIFNAGCTGEAYIMRLGKSRVRVLQNPATSQLDLRYKTAFAAFDASYDRLPSRAQKTLHLLSFCNRQGFPVELIDLAGEGGFSHHWNRYLNPGDQFERGRDCLKEIFCSSEEWDPVELDLIVTSLRNYSLVTIVLNGGVRLLHMHPLVHEWGRLRLPKDDKRRFEDAAVRLLCCGARETNHLMMKHLHSHVRSLSSVWGALHANDAASFGFILYTSGMSLDASVLEEACYRSLHKQLGADHFNTIRASANLASKYYQLGRYAEAEQLELEVLKQRTSILGVDHPDTIDASANLVSTYYMLGRYKEAEVLDTSVLQRQTTLFGDRHPDTLRAMLSLAYTYDALQNLSEAFKLAQKAHGISLETLGDGHPLSQELSEFLQSSTDQKDY